MTHEHSTAIDLFSGCGGIAAGLRDAGFDIVAGADIDPRYMSTFRHNFPEASSIVADLSTLDARSFMDQLRLQPGELDLLAGGPPLPRVLQERAAQQAHG